MGYSIRGFESEVLDLDEESRARLARVLIRSLEFPQEDGTTTQGVEIKVCRHPQYSYRHAHARWMYDDQDARAWWTCAQNGCCNF